MITLGAMSSTLRNTGSLSQASFMPLGGSGSFSCASSSPTSRSAATDSSPMPSATRSGVPNRLPSTGMSMPLRVLEQQGRAAGAQRAVADLGHLQMGIDLGA